MAPVGDQASLAFQARRLYAEELLKGLPALVSAVAAWAVAPERMNALATDPGIVSRLRDTAIAMKRHGVTWRQGMVNALQEALRHGVTPSRSGGLGGTTQKLSLVDDDTIEREILTSRLALAMMDRAGWEFADLRARMVQLERRDELDANDMLRPHVLARIVIRAWSDAGLD